MASRTNLKRASHRTVPCLLCGLGMLLLSGCSANPRGSEAGEGEQGVRTDGDSGAPSPESAHGKEKPDFGSWNEILHALARAGIEWDRVFSPDPERFPPHPDAGAEQTTIPASGENRYLVIGN